jgi:arylsulfatase A-like enzyme
MSAEDSDLNRDGLRRRTFDGAGPIWLAFIGATLEVVVLYVRKRSSPMSLRVSEDVVWMAPLGLLAIALAIVAACALVARVWRERPAMMLAWFATSTVVFLNLLMLVPGLWHPAAAILAAGMAAGTSRRVVGRLDDAGRVVRKTAPGLLAAAILGGAFMWWSLRPANVTPVATASAERRPSIVLITLDTVRASNLSLYGYARRTSPQLERLAERGVVFDRAFSSAPWTLPSHASLFTGRWPDELSASYSAPLDAAYPTLAEYLAGHGYATAGFVANLGYCSRDTGLARGFQHYEDYPRSPGQIASSSTLIRNVADNFRLRALIENDQHLSRVTAPELTDHALAWVSAHAGKPFFLFLNYFDAHEPYLPPAPFDRQFGPGRRAGRHSPLHHWLWNPAVAHGNMGEAERQEEIDAYDGALAFLDHHLERLLEGLERRGVPDDTVIVITSDHGEEFAEHGVYEHGYSLYRPGVQVPLLIVAPRRVPAGRRLAAPVSLRDVAATIAGIAGLSDGSPFPGRSLARLWAEDGASPGRDAGPVEVIRTELRRSPGQPDWFPSSKGDMVSAVYQDVRYIRNGDGTEEMYDLLNDPGERRNLIASADRQQVLAEIRALLRPR